MGFLPEHSLNSQSVRSMCKISTEYSISGSYRNTSGHSSGEKYCTEYWSHGHRETLQLDALGSRNLINNSIDYYNLQSLLDIALGGHIRQVRCVIVLGGSSIQGSGTFDTGAEDALCSGPTRPARLVSPEDAGTERHRCP